MFDGFTKHGSPSSPSASAANGSIAWPSRNARYRAYGQPGRRERPLHHDLVHRDRRPEHARHRRTAVPPARAVLAPCRLRRRDRGAAESTTSTARGVGEPPPLWVTNAPRPGSEGISTEGPATSKAAGRASRPPSNCATASSASSHRPSVVIATGTTSYSRRIQRRRDRDRGHARHVVLGRPAAEQQQRPVGRRHSRPPAGRPGSRAP